MNINEIEIAVKLLVPSSLHSLGTESWWKIQNAIQNLSQQTVLEIGCSSEENVKKALVEENKLAVLINEAICINVWRENVFPLVKEEAQKEKTKSFLIYMLAYHESSAISLLESVLYHKDVCQQLGDVTIDLIDYCASELIFLFTPVNNADLSEVEKQVNDVHFSVSMKCIAIVQYLAESLECLSVTSVTRFYKTHDFPMLFVHLIEKSPWRKKDGDAILTYNDGTWTRNHKLLARAEAHAWLALHQLLLFTDLGKHYQITEFAKGHFLKLNSLITDKLIDELAPLQQLKQGIIHLASFQLPTQSHGLILEVIPEIKNSLFNEGKDGWDKLAKAHTELILHCPTELTAQIAERLCDSLGKIPADLHTCANCNKVAKSRCSKCKKTWYCSRRCQVMDYSVHKDQCMIDK